MPVQVPVEALLEYWQGLPEEHRSALFQLREEDFAAELDAHLKYQLRICRDCRGNVYRAYRQAQRCPAVLSGAHDSAHASRRVLHVTEKACIYSRPLACKLGVHHCSVHHCSVHRAVLERIN